MAKPKHTVQAAFSFLDEVEKAVPEAKPKRQPLQPPAHIEAPAVQDNSEKEMAATPAVAVATLPETPAAEKIIFTIEAPKEAIDTAAADTAVTTPSPLPEATKPVVAQEKKSTRGRRSIKDNMLAADAVALPDDEQLFEKQYYSMGEVAALFKENHSLIRYWESEFSILKPKKNGKGDRFFRPIDVKNLYLIYDLLRRRKFTIEGAKEYLKNYKSVEEKFAAVQSLQKIKSFFLALKAGL